MNNLVQLSLGEQLKDSRGDATYHLDDGRVFPIFSRHGSEGDLIHCNICDEIIAPCVVALESHIEGHRHRQRLLDGLKAKAALLEYVQIYNIPEAKVSGKNRSQLHSSIVDRDDDSPPPGCEDVVQRVAVEPRIMSLLKSHTHAALLGLEYIMEINPDWDMDYIQETFYMCMLCNKRCDMNNILDHLVESKHRLKYLEKFFPRAYFKFQGFESCADNWNSETHHYLATVAWRIEQTKGRLKPCTFRRSQWDLKAAQLKASVENGIHLRESADLYYDDIPNPFFKGTESLEIRVVPSTSAPSNLDHNMIVPVPSVHSNPAAAASELDLSSQSVSQELTSLLPVKNQDQMTEDEVKKTREIIQREIQKFRSTYKGTDVLIPPTPKAGIAADSTGEAKEAIAELEKKKEEFMLKLTQLRQSILEDARSSVYYEKAKQQVGHIGTTGNRTCEAKQLVKTIEIDDDDDDIQVEKEILRRKSRSRSPQRRQNRCSRSPSSSRSSTRSNSRSYSRSSSSPSRSLSRQRSRRRRHHYGRRRNHHRHLSTDGRPDRGRILPHMAEQSSPTWVHDRYTPYSTRTEYSFRGSRSSNSYRHSQSNPCQKTYDSSRPKQDTTADINENKSRTLWANLERELSVLEETLHRKRLFYEKRPEDHPRYAEEWKLFWEKRYRELKAEGKDVNTYDFKPEWIVHWHQRMKELDLEEIRIRKSELKRKYGLDHSNKKEANSENDVEACIVVQEDNWKPVKFGWKKVSDNKSILDVLDIGKSTMIESVDEKELVRNPSPPLPPVEIPPDAEIISSPEGFDNMDVEAKSPSLDAISDDGNQSRDFHTKDYDGVGYSRHQGIQSKSNFRHSYSQYLPDSISQNHESKFGYRELCSNSLDSNCCDRESRKSLSSSRSYTIHDGEAGPADLLHVLRMLTAIEDNLGSLGPMINQLLARALAMERTRKGASVMLLEESACIDLLDTCKEKLKGQLVAGILDRTKGGAARLAISHVDLLFKSCLKSSICVEIPAPASTIINASSSTEARTAQQIANVLLNQGKANISDEELQQILASVLPNLKKDASATVAASQVINPILVASSTDKSSGQPHINNQISQPTASGGFDISTLITNLKAAGLLKLPVSEFVEPSNSAFEKENISAFPKVGSSYSIPPPDRIDYALARTNPNENSQHRNPESHSVPFILENIQDFSAEELKTLIFNFRNLTSSQQRDLVSYLRKLEVTDPNTVKQLRNSVSQPVSQTPPLQCSDKQPVSPLARKYQHFENNVNPPAPDGIPKSEFTEPSAHSSHSLEKNKNYQAAISRIDESKTGGVSTSCGKNIISRKLVLSPDPITISESKAHAAAETTRESTGEPISILTGRGNFTGEFSERGPCALTGQQYGQPHTVPWNSAQYPCSQGYYTQDHSQTSTNSAVLHPGTVDSNLYSLYQSYPPFYNGGHS